MTIGITTYNRADTYLRHALESAVAQGYPELEILVSDNASTDGTETLVRSFADPRIRYMKQERNIGVTAHFNYCLSQACGAYFLLLHDDDAIDPDFIETCMTAAQDRTSYGLIRTGMRRIDGAGRVMKEQRNLTAGLGPEEFFRAVFAGGVPMHLCCTLFNTGRLREVGGFASRRDLYCDVVPEVYLAARYGRLDVEDVKASFRIHGANHSAKGRVEDWCVDSHHLLQIILEEVGSADRSFRRAGMHYFIRHCMRYARSVPSARERWAAYYAVYRTFDHTPSYLIRTGVSRPAYSFLKKGVRRVKALV